MERWQSMTGYDTSNPIQNVYASAQSEFGVDPDFWIRYFPPSPAADLFNDDAVAESRGPGTAAAPSWAAFPLPCSPG